MLLVPLSCRSLLAGVDEDALPGLVFAVAVAAEAPGCGRTEAPDAIMLADAGAPTVLAEAPLAVMLANAGAPTVLALAPDARADAAMPRGQPLHSCCAVRRRRLRLPCGQRQCVHMLE